MVQKVSKNIISIIYFAFINILLIIIIEPIMLILYRNILKMDPNPLIPTYHTRQNHHRSLLKGSLESSFADLVDGNEDFNQSDSSDSQFNPNKVPQRIVGESILLFNMITYTYER